MPGYFGDQDTSQAKKKKQTLHITAKGKETMITYYQEYDGLTQGRLKKKFYQEIHGQLWGKGVGRGMGRSGMGH